MGKKNPKDAGKKERSKQQKKKSTTVKAIQVPAEEKPPDQEETGTAIQKPVNLCDECLYEFGECDGKPKFASDLQEGLTGAEADLVVECEGYVNVESIPTREEVDILQDEKESEDDKLRQEEEAAVDAEKGNGLEPTPYDIAMGKLDEFGQAILYDYRGEIEDEAARRYKDEVVNPEDVAKTLILIVAEYIERTGGPSSGLVESEEVTLIPAAPDARPDPKRFNQEEDFGKCSSCQRSLKRTAHSRYRDAVRCTNPRCRNYRQIVKLISSGELS